MKYLLSIFFLLVLVTTVSAKPLPGNFDDEINTFIQRIPESVLSVKITNYNSTILVIAEGASGNVYALGIGPKNLTSESSSNSSNSYPSYYDDNINSDEWKAIKDEFRGGVSDSDVFADLAVRIITNYPAAVDSYDVSNAESVVLYLMDAAQGPGMLDDMMELLMTEVSINPDSNITGEVNAISTYTMAFAPERIVEIVNTIDDLNNPTGDVFGLITPSAMRAYFSALKTPSNKDNADSN